MRIPQETRYQVRVVGDGPELEHLRKRGKSIPDPPFGYRNFLYYASLRQNTIYRYKIIINHYI